MQVSEKKWIILQNVINFADPCTSAAGRQAKKNAVSTPELMHLPPASLITEYRSNAQGICRYTG
jgi:hypothetical protein